MQQYPTRRPSNAPMLIAAVGIGALVTYALWSPRRRAALLAAGGSALQAGSRLAASSVDRLQELLPEQAQDAVGGVAAAARSASQRAASTASDTLHSAVDRASELMQELLSRVRAMPAVAGGSSREEVRDTLESAEEALDTRTAGHSAGRGMLIAAAAIGAGLYAMNRYGASERVRDKLGAHESGCIVTEQSLFIDAPVEQVFDTWADCQNFPRFMSNVQSVRPLEGNRSHWSVRGPAGVGVEFDSVTHLDRPNQIAWESEPGSTVENEGRVTLVPEGSGTRATVRLSYRPPAGAVGQAVSALFGADPKQEFEDDLNRMKQFIEGRRSGATLPV